jgi:predicted MFS family arabinose efflux permease
MPDDPTVDELTDAPFEGAAMADAAQAATAEAPPAWTELEASDLPPPGKPAYAQPFTATEWLIAVLIAAVQFIAILEFMILMPLGPDLAQALHVDPSKLGLVGGSYTAAAAISGLIAALFLDRFDRRPALAISMTGLVLATAAGAMAWDLHSLMAARMLAGIFGGPAGAVGLAIIADYFAPAVRGRAMGAVMGGFTLASVAGVPLGLKLAEWGGWRLPLYGISALGLVVIFLVAWRMPPIRAHLAQPRRPALPQLLGLLQRKPVVYSLLAVGLAMCGAFALIPHISAYLQFNHGYPRNQLGLLYLIGGIVSFGIMQLAGRLSDKYGSARVVAGGTAILGISLLAGFIFGHFFLPIIVVFVLFMSAQGIRNVAVNALTSRVPAPHERASFQSAQSAVQNLAAALGGGLSTLLLREVPQTHQLRGIPLVALLALVMSIATPILLRSVQRMVREEERTRAAEATIY